MPNRDEGSWQNGKQHGQGRYYHLDGTSILALWEEGRRLERLEDPVPEPLPMSDSTAECHDTATDAPADPPPDAKGCVENSGS